MAERQTCRCRIYYTRIMPTAEHAREMRDVPGFDVPGFWMAVAIANDERLGAAIREHKRECREPFERILALAALSGDSQHGR